MCYDEMNVSIQKLQEIGLSTVSKIMLKTLNAHNFLNIYRNTEIGAQNVCINSRNPNEEEFLQFHLTSSHNYSK